MDIASLWRSSTRPVLADIAVSDLAQRSQPLYCCLAMSNRAGNDKSMRAYLKLMGNPYASLSISDVLTEVAPSQMTHEEKRSRFRKMQNPYAYFDFFGEPEDCKRSHERLGQGQLELVSQIGQVAEAQKEIVSRADVERELNEVLQLYKPYVARNEWARVIEYRTEWLDGVTASTSTRVVERLQKFRFALIPGEKVEFNRAHAERIIAELKRLLV